MAQAKSISEEVKIKLLDGKTEVVLRPLSIKRLREFMAEWGKIGKIEIEADSVEGAFMNIFVNCAAIALKSQLPEQTKFIDDEDESRDDFEDLIDMNMVNKINEICGGIKFDDEANPNRPAARAEAGTA